MMSLRSAIKFYPVIWKEQVVLVVGAASSRDHLISRLEAAPTVVFFGNLDFPNKRLILFVLPYRFFHLLQFNIRCSSFQCLMFIFFQ